MSNAECIRVASATEIDALVGGYLFGESPEVYWEHSHGCFQFETEEEAWQAVRNSYYQLFLPEIDWMTTIVREVRQFPAYCGGPGMIWRVVDKASMDHGPLRLRHEIGRWRASFGKEKEVEGRTPAVAICLAALRAHGLKVEVDHDRLDAELNRLAAAHDLEDGALDSSTATST